MYACILFNANNRENMAVFHETYNIKTILFIKDLLKSSEYGKYFYIPRNFRNINLYKHLFSSKPIRIEYP